MGCRRWGRRVGFAACGAAATLVAAPVTGPAVPPAAAWEVAGDGPVAMPEDPAFGAFGAAAAAGGESVVYVGQGDTTFAVTWTNGGGGWEVACGAGGAADCAPGVRTAAGLAEGPDGVVLYGGLEGPFGQAGTIHGDQWRWTGAEWVQDCTTAGAGACGPGPRVGHALAGNGAEVLLFGGYDSGPAAKSDTWVYDGAAWSQACADDACGLPHAFGGTMFWDGAAFVLTTPVSGGIATWTWTGTAWELVCGAGGGEHLRAAAACGPPSRQLASAAPLPGGGAVLGGGVDLGVDPSLWHRDRWRWDGSGWTELPLPWDTSAVDLAAPVARCGPIIPYLTPDAASGEIRTLALVVGPDDPAVHALREGDDVRGDALADLCTGALVPATTTTTAPAATTTTGATAPATTTTTAAPSPSTTAPAAGPTTTSTTTTAAPATLPATGAGGRRPGTGAALLLLAAGAGLALAARPRGRYTRSR